MADKKNLPELGPAIPIRKRVRDVYPEGESGIIIIKKGKKRRTKINVLVKRKKKRE